MAIETASLSRNNWYR